MDKDVSARDMSLSLGLSESYINKIENEKTLPSMSVFFDICDYFRISPQEFFNMGEPFPADITIAIGEMNRMSKEQLARMIAFMKDINHRG
ncbi:MAG: helix-turn-helix domain-containing protein [bacterium]|nr:helix-turn-helix domain-containing protein [bacterium]